MQKLDKIQKLIFNYYEFSSSRSLRINKNNAVARATAYEKPRYELTRDIVNKGKIEFHFVLKKYITIGRTEWEYSDDLSELKHTWVDFLPNDLMFPLMSERLKDVIISCLKGSEGISFLPVMVYANNEQKQYYVLKFEHSLDVLHEEKTKYVKNTGSIILPVFSFLKIAKYSIFHTPSYNSEIPHILHMNGEMKKKIQKEKMTGVYFERIYNIWS